MEPVGFQAPQMSHPDVPFKERWDLLKPQLERFYLDEKLKLSSLIQKMKNEYGFDANEAQYKYQFKQWGWKKNIPASKKAEVLELGQRRAALGKATVVKYKGKDVDPKKLRRHAKEVKRKDIAFKAAADAVGGRQSAFLGSVLPFGNSIFLNWTMPYGVLRATTHHPSPLGPSVSTPSDVSITTPPADTICHDDTPSQLSVALRKKATIDRAHLFVQGKYDDLVRSMNQVERKMMSTWLYQFWFFSFKTAKHWGRGPPTWTADNLGFTQGLTSTSISYPTTPTMPVQLPELALDAHIEVDPIPKPSSLCRWSIHIEVEDYQPVPSPPPEHDYFEEQEEKNWTQWPESWSLPPFEDRLRTGLESNNFSSIESDHLPVAISQLATAAERSPNELLQEALGFAIMGRNADLVEELLGRMEESDVSSWELYPLHLAISYLDGSKSCCTILSHLSLNLSFNSLRKCSVNELGHTILDNFMIAILKGHTSLVPGAIDDALKGQTRFAGEEVDICGRWDADSDCFRTLLASGRSSIPFEWKHKFCHTSAQAICHSIYSSAWVPASLNESSGLFLKHCSNCGQKLQLLPLHSLVWTAFHLAQSGCEGEDLFGVVACLLCLLSLRVNPLLKTPISLAALLDEEQIDGCSHVQLTPLQLAQSVPTITTDKWSRKTSTGWQILCHVLKNAQDVREPIDVDDENEGTCRMDPTDHFLIRCRPERCSKAFGNNVYLGHIWAAAQTEMLTYRRLEEETPWVSENFDMDALLESLDAGTRVSIKLVDEQMMQPYCACGEFEADHTPARREHVAAHYFSNLEDWNRTTFIQDK